MSDPAMRFVIYKPLHRNWLLFRRDDPSHVPGRDSEWISQESAEREARRQGGPNVKVAVVKDLREWPFKD